MNETSDFNEMNDLVLHLEANCSNREFKGSDPYDAMNSPLLSLLSFNTKIGRIFWTQMLRRCPIDFRKILFVPSRQNPKGLGLFLDGYTRMSVLSPDEERWKNGINKLLCFLDACRSPNWHGNAWGYHFPWQSRAAFVPCWTPTIVNTAFIGHALLNTWTLTGNLRARDMAERTAGFLLNDLNRKKHVDGSFCFSYTPLDHNYVHNANMLGASLLARLGVLNNNEDWQEQALAALRYSMNHQRADGSWPYAETDFQNWIDSFHTGFNLEALRCFLRLNLVPEYMECFSRGLSFYKNNFYLPDGRVKYYHDRLYCVDIHSICEAISFFADEEEPEILRNTIKYLIEKFYNPRTGLFYFREYSFYMNKIHYMRWGQAWVFRALTRYLYRQQEGNNYESCPL